MEEDFFKGLTCQERRFRKHWKIYFWCCFFIGFLCIAFSKDLSSLFGLTAFFIFYVLCYRGRCTLPLTFVLVGYICHMAVYIPAAFGGSVYLAYKYVDSILPEVSGRFFFITLSTLGVIGVLFLIVGGVLLLQVYIFRLHLNLWRINKCAKEIRKHPKLSDAATKILEKAESVKALKIFYKQEEKNWQKVKHIFARAYRIHLHRLKTTGN